MCRLLISSNKVIIIEIEFPSSCPGLWPSEHQMCIRVMSNTGAAVTIKDTSVLESDDIMSRDQGRVTDRGSHPVSSLVWSVCVLLRVRLILTPESWVSPSSSDILNCNPLMSHKMYWLGNEGTSYTLLTTTLISSGSSPGKQNNSPAFYPRSLFILQQQNYGPSVVFISRICPN